MIRLILALVVALVALIEGVYGTYCGLLMYFNLKPNLPLYGMIPTNDQLTPRGQRYMRKWLWSWGIGVLLAILLALLYPAAA